MANGPACSKRLRGITALAIGMAMVMAVQGRAVAASPPPPPPAPAPADGGMSQWYMRAYHVDAAEAARRLRASQPAGKLGARMAAEQASTFAGLYIEHSPAFRIVVRFTDDAAAQLARYTQDPDYVAETAPRSLRELRATQGRVVALMMEHHIRFISGLDIHTSRVTLHVLDPAQVQRLLARQLPGVDYVDVKKTTGFLEPTADGALPATG